MIAENLVDAFNQMLQNVIAFIPALIGAIIVILVGYVVGKFVGKAVNKLIEKFGIEKGFDQTSAGKPFGPLA